MQNEQVQPVVKPPVISKADIESKIVTTHYHRFPDTTTTVACIVFVNGHAETGQSSCIKPEDYDEQLGQRYARENAIEKCFNAFAYAHFEAAK